MGASFKIPFYARIALISIALFAFVYTLFLGQQIIIPLVFGTILAILLNPFVSYLIGKRINKIIAISIAVILAIISILIVLYIVSSQITMFSETYPQLKTKFTISSNELVHWVSDKFNIRVSKINTWTKETQIETINNFELAEKLTEVGGIVLNFMLLPVYLFMILYYKPLLLDFIRRLFKSEHHEAVEEVLTKTKKIIQSYLVGLFIEMVIIAILSSATLFFLGIDYALILGIT